MKSAIVSSATKVDAPMQRSKSRDLIEIAIALALILIVIWTPRPLQQVLWLASAAGLGILIGASPDDRRAMGLSRRNLLSSLWVVGAALAFAAVAIGLAVYMHTLEDKGGPLQLIRSFLGYVIWAGVQQFLLQGFFLLRLLRLLPKPWQAVCAAAGLFALAHLPNPVLAGLTILWGTLACFVFLRYRNVLPLAVAHAILGITISLAVPGPVDHNMRVGLGYLRYNKESSRPLPQRSQIDQIVSTVACVTAEVPTRRLLLQARP